VESRLLLTKEKGRGGEYWYFFCSARQDHACDAPYIRIEDAEAGVLRLSTQACDCRTASPRECEALTDTLADEERSGRMVHEHLSKRLVELEAK